MNEAPKRMSDELERSCLAVELMNSIRFGGPCEPDAQSRQFLVMNQVRRTARLEKYPVPESVVRVIHRTGEPDRPADSCRSPRGYRHRQVPFGVEGIIRTLGPRRIRRLDYPLPPPWRWINDVLIGRDVERFPCTRGREPVAILCER